MAFLGCSWVSAIEVDDPGNGGLIDNQGSGYVLLNLGTTAETRSIQRPIFIGQLMQFYVISDGGSSIAITFEGSSELVDGSAGLNTVTFNGNGDFFIAIAVLPGANLEWRELIRYPTTSVRYS